jgi:hypothetical protein
VNRNGRRNGDSGLELRAKEGEMDKIVRKFDEIVLKEGNKWICVCREIVTF